MRLFIKNKQSIDCSTWPKSILDELQVGYDRNIRHGALLLTAMIQQDTLSKLQEKLNEKGYAIIYDRKNILAEQIKHLVCEMLENNRPPEENYSQFISSRLHLNYTYLANTFSETQSVTIEQFIIIQKIEKAKKLLRYSDNSIGQIADKLHYSSIGHLSNQFKKITGINPSEFKKQVQ